MKQNEFKILVHLIETEVNGHILYMECYKSLKEDKILLHDLGIFERSKIVGNLKDKISLKEHNIQDHSIVGIDSLHKNLNSYFEKQVRQVSITTSHGSYLIIISANLEKLIGIAKNPDMNIEKDLQNQIQLKNF